MSELRRIALASMLLLASVVGLAKEAVLRADDPVLQAHVLRISEELRCLVCQNETLAASNAELAIDLRNQIRLQITQGRSDAQIRDYMVQRYGDFVLYRPPLKASTWLLWIGPFVLLLIAALALARQIRSRRLTIAQSALSPAEAQRARELLEDKGSPPT